MADSRIAIIGLGLIGSSLARAVRTCLPESRLTVSDICPETRQAAEKLQIADVVTDDPLKAVEGASLVVLAVPVQALSEVMQKIAPGLAKDALITDVTSVKIKAMEDITPHLPEGVHYIPGHPVAGSEQSGIEAGSALLFAGKPVVLTPESPEEPGVPEIAEFWNKLNAQVVYMPPEMHDKVYACVSHLPHYLALCIATLSVGRDITPPEGEAFERYVRLQKSNPDLWKNIFDANKEFINSYLDRYLQVIHQIRSELREGMQEAEEGGSEDCASVISELFPYVAATAMVAVTQVVEQELRISIKPFVGSGFLDFTAPVFTNPEQMLEKISLHAKEMVTLLDDYSMLLSSRRYLG